MIDETIDIRELTSRLSEWLSLVAQGKEITIVQDEKPVARLVPPDETLTERIPGLHKGEIWISEDFDEPLPELFWVGEA
jgi:antitoxin (DNA-binding transcriptional repressor) of toxin-antitoxin stability system